VRFNKFVTYAGLAILATSTLCTAESFEGPITEQAREFGSKTCINEINKIDTFLNEDAGANGAWSTSPKENPEQRIYAALNVKAYNDGTWGYDAITVAPGTHGCDGTLMRVVTYPNKSCTTVRETTYKDYKYLGEIAGKAIYESGSTKTVLENLTGSCIAIRYEVLFPVPK
jgi:hypothetical protein